MVISIHLPVVDMTTSTILSIIMALSLGAEEEEISSVVVELVEAEAVEVAVEAEDVIPVAIQELVQTTTTTVQAAPEVEEA
jgi:hypothetical protein